MSVLTHSCESFKKILPFSKTMMKSQQNWNSSSHLPLNGTRIPFKSCHQHRFNYASHSTCARLFARLFFSSLIHPSTFMPSRHINRKIPLDDLLCYRYSFISIHSLTHSFLNVGNFKTKKETWHVKERKLTIYKEREWASFRL